ncbi:hypothetical protein [Glaciecola sp. KUL10]|uniref:hypothetical protein n=1 Tax=Glaciecola sp. (strain KUL10) TaxID=2161813 RepID=UPI000D857B44|nr:hypothetical protein [Glaciecola sp. KUL10]GBL05404.1 hypothetical protein KUL10_27240 [Glaciecola sp. KUL10]
MKAVSDIDDNRYFKVSAKRKLPAEQKSHINLSQVITFAIATIVILLAMASFITDMNLADILTWVEAYFGVSFTLIYFVLMGVGAISFVRIHHDIKPEFWYEVGQQAGNGISTLALTFTLLGISLGIGTLSGQALTPETVEPLIGELTAQFSLAFMTTVVGLPSATLVRASISIKFAARVSQQEAESTIFINGENK